MQTSGITRAALDEKRRYALCAAPKDSPRSVFLYARCIQNCLKRRCKSLYSVFHEVIGSFMTLTYGAGWILLKPESVRLGYIDVEVEELSHYSSHIREVKFESDKSRRQVILL